MWTYIFSIEKVIKSKGKSFKKFIHVQHSVYISPLTLHLNVEYWKFLISKYYHPPTQLPYLPATQTIDDEIS